MTEAALDSLLDHGSRRLRARRALRTSLVILGCSVLMLAAGLFAWRSFVAVPVEEATRLQTTQALLVVLPILIALLSFGILYALTRLDGATVAGTIDRAARLQDHLVTWFELRGRDLSPQQAEFRDAQSRETMRLASGLSPKALIPLRLPAWTPALWLALILLCSSLLVPPQIETESKAAAREREQARRRTPAAMLAQGEQQGPASATTPRVQPLSPTELWKLQLRASDPTITAEQKRQLLNELQQKTGAIPESELTSEIRELLSQLREPDSGVKTGQLDKTASTGSSQQASNNGGEKPSQVHPAAANDALIRERGIARAANDFVDVRDELIRYYSGGAKQ